MFFDILNNVLYNKKSDDHTLSTHEAEFSAFMLNRWCSMHSDQACNLINITTNKYCTLFEDKKLTYKMYIHMLPAMRSKRINYIKKIKNSDASDDDQLLIDQLACNVELSKREINNNIQHERQYRPTSTD